MNAVLKTSEKDNVVTCLRALIKGEEITVEGKKYIVNEDIPQYHKMAIGNIKEGSTVIKYNQAIGVAKKDINVGDYVHVHNIDSARGRGDKK